MLVEDEGSEPECTAPGCTSRLHSTVLWPPKRKRCAEHEDAELSFSGLDLLALHSSTTNGTGDGAVLFVVFCGLGFLSLSRCGVLSA